MGDTSTVFLYTIYKTTNKSNGKIYIGCHITSNVDDGYLGSGKYLQRAIKKYGEENFSKEILHVFDNIESMFQKEKELVTEEFIKRFDTYNLRIGGEGGWDYVNKSGSNTKSKELRGLAVSKALKGRKNPHLTEKMKLLHKEGKIKYNTFTGKHHTEESKDKMRQKLRGRTPWNKGLTKNSDSRIMKYAETLSKLHK